ncbi:hypothetical protein F4825DRAFT_474284 [Nemania diffusa]|nr:hypothetical protein F4825DRAFT_474284 [Nemania diffusa]
MEQLRWLYHYTDKAGYEGILVERALKASVIEGKKHTHYGKGVYLTDLAPDDFKHIGDKACIEWLFNRPNGYAVQKTCYVITLDREAMAKANIGMQEMVDRPKFGHIWLVPLESDLDISQFYQLAMCGMTEIGRKVQAGVDLSSVGSDDPEEETTPRTTRAAMGYAHSLRNHGGNLGVYPVEGVPEHDDDELWPEVPLDDRLRFNEPIGNGITEKKRVNEMRAYEIDAVRRNDTK